MMELAPDLLVRAQSGDREAQGALIRSYQAISRW
jgi:hypothetical protein